METELGRPDLGVWLLLAAIPLVLAVATAFTKASVVLGALRVGLGAETILPLPAVLAMALVVTAVVMGPTAAATLDVIEGQGGLDAVVTAPATAWIPVFDPLRDFLVRHASVDELGFFAELQGRSSDDPLVVVPAFLVTELTEALTMAVVILVPFVLVDLLVAQLLVLVGLVNQPTPIVTVPLKLMLFLAVGGWDVVIGGLVEGYA
jgi:flagellar biosynthesis protein FliP